MNNDETKNIEDKINNSFLIAKNKIHLIKNNIIDKNTIINFFVLIDNKKIFLKKISDCLENGEEIILSFKNKKYLMIFYKKISLINFYKIKVNRNKLIISLDKKKIGTKEKKKEIVNLINNYKISINILINKFKKRSLAKNNSNDINRIRNILKNNIIILEKNII
ncbi:hypothetical protein ACWNX6_00515 [Candidatus Vidania fulgoroideorum]